MWDTNWINGGPKIDLTLIVVNDGSANLSVEVQTLQQEAELMVPPLLSEIFAVTAFGILLKGRKRCWRLSQALFLCTSPWFTGFRDTGKLNFSLEFWVYFLSFEFYSWVLGIFLEFGGKSVEKLNNLWVFSLNWLMFRGNWQFFLRKHFI